MTINMDELAQKIGYDSMRQYIVLNYYLPRKFSTLTEIAEDFKVSDWKIREWMKVENLPVREKGHPRTREGFYCEVCQVLTSLRYIWYNRSNDKFICNTCMESIITEGEPKCDIINIKDIRRRRRKKKKPLRSKS